MAMANGQEKEIKLTSTKAARKKFFQPDQRQGLRGHHQEPGRDGERVLPAGGVYGAPGTGETSAPGLCAPGGSETPDPAPGG